MRVNYKKVANQIKSIHEIAKENAWVTYYDSELDGFYVSPKVINSSFSLQSIGKEFLVYLDSRSNVGGIFIEYFKNNLASHDEKFKPFKKIINKDKKFDSKEKTFLLSTLEAALLEEITPLMAKSN